MSGTKVLIIILACMCCTVSGFGEIHWSPTLDSNFTAYELQKFEEHQTSRLPIYISYFKKYSELYQIPWPLLAAVAYQESKWDHAARSYTGVRGLMQITEQTAEHIGVTDRRDPIQNIKGGAYYLKYLFDKTSPELSSMQRWSLALIAYNIGWGHLSDASKLALKLNKDPLDWNDLKTVLPMLEVQNYYSELNHGYARGNETVEFVQNVFSYYTMLAQNQNLAKL
jgi:membrane-bound lytic murein transglycosylase F